MKDKGSDIGVRVHVTGTIYLIKRNGRGIKFIPKLKIGFEGEIEIAQYTLGLQSLGDN